MTHTLAGHDRHLMRGTAGGDFINVADLVAFDWRPYPGDAATYRSEMGHWEQQGESFAWGRVVFEGISSAAAFAAQPAGLHFTFSSGYSIHSTTAHPLLSPGAPWTWDPATGVLNPHGARGWLPGNIEFQFGMGGASFDAHGTLDWPWRIWGSDAGRWELRAAATPAEVLAGKGDDMVLGGGGGDRLLGGDGQDALWGGGGGDVIDGQRGDDVILSGDGADVASGGSGNDLLQGEAGRDTLHGHAGDDVLEGGAGADHLFGGAGLEGVWGFDTASYAASAAGVSVDLAAGLGRGGDAEGDRLGGIAGLWGSGFADTLLGDGAANWLLGSGGDDVLAGGGGADLLDGGAGDDMLRSGLGEENTLLGGAGFDTLALTLTAGQVADSEVGAELARLKAFTTSSPSSDATFASALLGITASGIEAVEIDAPRAHAAVRLEDVARGVGGFKIIGPLSSWYGLPAIGAGDVNGDGLADLLLGSPEGPAAAFYVVFGRAGGAPVDLAHIAGGGFQIAGMPYPQGTYPQSLSAAGPGDVNGDGLADLLVSVLWRGEGIDGYDALSIGRTHLVFGQAGTDAVALADVAAGRGGFAIGSYEPVRSLSGAGDMNGDGLADLLLGHAEDVTEYSRYALGYAHVVHGKADGDAVDLAGISYHGKDGGFGFMGRDFNDGFGYDVAGAGDVNGDGMADLVFGAPSYAGGTAWVAFGRPAGFPAGLSDIGADLGFKIIGEGTYSGAGTVVSAAGDVNGDGLADLLVGAPYGGDWRGAFHVVFGKADGAAVHLEDVARGAGGFKIIGEAANDFAGSDAAAAAGDLNGDGLADLLLGVSTNGRDAVGNATGAAYVVFGKADGTAVHLGDIARGVGGLKIVPEAGHGGRRSISVGRGRRERGRAGRPSGDRWRRSGRRLRDLRQRRLAGVTPGAPGDRHAAPPRVIETGCDRPCLNPAVPERCRKRCMRPEAVLVF